VSPILLSRPRLSPLNRRISKVLIGYDSIFGNAEQLARQLQQTLGLEMDLDVLQLNQAELDH